MPRQPNSKVTPPKKKRAAKKTPVAKTPVDKGGAKKGDGSKVYGGSKKAKLTITRGVMQNTRWRAAIVYTTDPARPTMEIVWQRLFSEDVSFDMFRKWAALDKWTERRVAHWAQVTAAVAREMVGHHAEARSTELAQLKDALDISMGHVTGVDRAGNIVPLHAPKDFGEAVRGVTSLHKAVEETRDRVLATMPMAASPDAVDEPLVGFSEDELRAMAQARLRVRHGLAAPDGEADAEADPS